MKSPETFFWARVKRGRPNECWPHVTAQHKPGYEYGYARWRGKSQNAHRVAWMIVNKSDIPKGQEICHTCDNRACCNPAHLWIGTHAANMWDGQVKGRINGLEPMCPYGHPYAGNNLYLTPADKRQCKTCRRVREACRRRQLIAKGLTTDKRIPHMRAIQNRIIPDLKIADFFAHTVGPQKRFPLNVKGNGVFQQESRQR